MVYPFRKSLMGFILILMLGFPFLFALSVAFSNSYAVPYAIILGTLLVFQLWVYIGSKCVIKNGKLTVVAGPVRRSCAVKEIKSVQYRVVEMRAMRVTKYHNILISHSKGEYFISTMQGERLLDKLHELRPNIKIEKVQFAGK